MLLKVVKIDNNYVNYVTCTHLWCIFPQLPHPLLHTDPSQVDILDLNWDHNAFAGALKLYLRELPNPVFTYQLYELFVSAGSECQPHPLQILYFIVSVVAYTHFLGCNLSL